MIPPTISPELAAQLFELRTWLLPAHILGACMGLGSVMATDLLFLRALKDKKISDDEQYLLKGLSMIIWVGLAVLATSGFLLALPNIATWLQNPAYLGKQLAVVILLINGILLNVIVTPQLTKINFAGSNQPSVQTARAKKLAFILGGVSATSWYTVFVLAFVMQSGSSLLLDRPIWTYVVVVFGLVAAAKVGGFGMYTLANRLQK